MTDGKRKTRWSDFLEFPVMGRNVKPRETGLTMVIDKGLGYTETKELLELAAEYIDFIKLGFGTSALYSAHLLRRKIELVRSHGVHIFPGGTFLEVAILQGKLKEYLRISRELGYSGIEVSDGTIKMEPEVRADAIKRAVDLGFIVLSEVGKKDPRDHVESLMLHKQIEEDLRNGAYKVIVEGRESGKGVVIYDSKGEVKRAELNALQSAVKDLNAILWEAPLKKQQQELIMQFGPNVNLGNIQPNEVLALEALRLGLRGDTLRTCLQSGDSAVDKMPVGEEIKEA